MNNIDEDVDRMYWLGIDARYFVVGGLVLAIIAGYLYFKD